MRLGDGDLTSEELKVLERYASSGLLLSTPPKAIADKLQGLGYIAQKLGGMMITDKGMMRLMNK